MVITAEVESRMAHLKAAEREWSEKPCWGGDLCFVTWMARRSQLCGKVEMECSRQGTGRCSRREQTRHGWVVGDEVRELRKIYHPGLAGIWIYSSARREATGRFSIGVICVFTEPRWLLCGSDQAGASMGSREGGWYKAREGQLAEKKMKHWEVMAVRCVLGTESTRCAEGLDYERNKDQRWMQGFVSSGRCTVLLFVQRRS